MATWTEEFCHVACNALQLGRMLPAFRRNILYSISRVGAVVKMNKTGSFETLEGFYHTIRLHFYSYALKTEATRSSESLLTWREESSYTESQISVQSSSSCISAVFLLLYTHSPVRLAVFYRITSMPYLNDFFHFTCFWNTWRRLQRPNHTTPNGRTITN